MSQVPKLVALAVISLTAAGLVYADEQPVNMPTRGICAHRGASVTHPENTLVALEEAIRLGAHMLEFDVTLTRDEQLVLMHDATVDRTTDGTGPIERLTLEEVKATRCRLVEGSSIHGGENPDAR